MNNAHHISMAFEFGQFLFQMLKPVARLCMRRGIKLQAAEEALRQAFVSCARDELISSRETLSVSRVSLMTGLHRRDIPRLLEESGAVQPKDQNLLTRVLGQWQADKRFKDGGRPRALTFEGMESEFVELVRSVNREFNPYTVLFELERIGAVQRRDNTIVLQNGVLDASGSVEQGLGLLASDLSDLVGGVSENVFTRPNVPNLHIKTEYDNICLDAVDDVRAWFLDKGSAFHEQARSYLARHDKDLNPRLFKKPGGARVAIGTFSFVELPQSEKEDESGAD